VILGLTMLCNAETAVQLVASQKPGPGWHENRGPSSMKIIMLPAKRKVIYLRTLVRAQLKIEQNKITPFSTAFLKNNQYSNLYPCDSLPGNAG
jgi:hypothetical protein